MANRRKLPGDTGGNPHANEPASGTIPAALRQAASKKWPYVVLIVVVGIIIIWGT